MKVPLTKKHFAYIAIGFFSLGIGLSYLWHAAYNPMKPLYVEIVNDTDKLIPSVVIEHGRPGLQEKITLVQLRSKESRVLALNHKPGMGFNVHVNFADGTFNEICAGKNKGYWFFRETITKFGVYSTPVR